MLSSKAEKAYRLRLTTGSQGAECTHGRFIKVGMLCKADGQARKAT
jgi:hypothetical protein